MPVRGAMEEFISVMTKRTVFMPALKFWIGQ